MNTKNNQRPQNILNLLLALAVLIPVILACNNQPTAVNQPAPATVNTPAPADTLAEEKPKKDGNPAEVFYGTWEKEEQGQPFRFEKFGIASKKGDNYTGKVTDQNNTVVANYTVYEDKTVEIAYLPAYYNGTTYTYSYKVSDGGNKLTLDSNPPIVYTKGSANTNIQKDATILATGSWLSATDQSKRLAFTDAKQYDKGWNGNYLFVINGAPDEQGTFTITEAGKITLTSSSSGGSTAYTYNLRSDKLFDLTRDKDGQRDTYSQ